jgi:RTA1 like protein
MGGIGLQQGFLLLFVLLMVRFHVDVQRIGRSRTASWRPLLYAQYIALTLITVSLSPKTITNLTKTN